MLKVPQGDRMDVTYRKHLNAAAVEVFGTMYFTPVELLTEPPCEEERRFAEEYVQTSISYWSPGGDETRLDFYFPMELASTIAEGFLGIEIEDVREAQLLDTMREAGNMIGGNLLGRIDPDGKSRLGIPRASRATGVAEVIRAAGDVQAFLSDYGMIWVLVKDAV